MPKPKNYPKKNKYTFLAPSFNVLSALLIWFFTVLTEMCNLTAISSYFIPSLLASKNTSLHFSGKASIAVQIRASS